ncbi:MAG: ZIP family metal transporter [Rhodothermales bacterium]|nr:ZIP family metal transporter [Rhodothermales bacterium]
MEVWLYALASVVLVSLVSLAGAFTLSLKPARLERIVFLLVSFAVGAMLGGAVIHLIPRAYAQLGAGHTTGLLVLAGVLAFFVLEKFLHWRHEHGVAVAATEAEVADALGVEPAPIRPFATMNLVGDAAHNLIDGMIIAAAYLVSIPTGLVTTVAVMLHEIPQEIGDFGVLVYGGLEPKRALLYNFLSALGAVVGAVLSLALGAVVEGYAAYLLPLTAGSFIYIAGSDLIPELHHHHSYPASKSVAQFVMIVLGVLVMLLPALFGEGAGMPH